MLTHYNNRPKNWKRPSAPSLYKCSVCSNKENLKWAYAEGPYGWLGYFYACKPCRDKLDSTNCFHCNKPSFEPVCKKCLTLTNPCKICKTTITQDIRNTQLFILLRKNVPEIELCTTCRNTHRLCGNCKEYTRIETYKCEHCNSVRCYNCNTYFSKEICPVCSDKWNYVLPLKKILHTNEKEQSNTLFLGIEFEFAYPDDRLNSYEIAKKIRKTTIPCWVGDDFGNIEFRTMPLSRKWIQNNKSKFETFFTKLKQNKFKDHDRAGIHIHISKAAFEDKYHLYRLCKLLYENPDESETIAGRVSNFGSLRTESLEDIREKTENPNAQKAGKYYAVNVNLDHTIELRLFRSTLNLREFWERLYFTLAIFDFTAQITDARSITWSNFKTFVEENTKHYPYLNTALNRAPKTIAAREPTSVYPLAPHQTCPTCYFTWCASPDCSSCAEDHEIVHLDEQEEEYDEPDYDYDGDEEYYEEPDYGDE